MSSPFAQAVDDRDGQDGPEAGRRVVAACPVCRSPRVHYAFSVASHRVVRCADCRLMLLNPQPTDAELAAFAGRPASPDQFIDYAGRAMADASDRLFQLARYRGPAGGALLEISCGAEGHSPLAAEAQRAGYQVTRVCLTTAGQSAEGGGPVRRLSGSAVVCDRLEAAGLAAGQFEVCALAGALERSRDPMALLRTVHALLKPGGVLLVGSTVPRRANAAAFRPDHLTYFDPPRLLTALHQAGFRGAIARPAADGSGNVRVMARAAAASARQTLSVVVPAFNERATIGPLMDALLAKRLAGMEIEVILVESNSTDGTRETARRYAHHPRVRLVLEERPRGKGHAVRAGLAHATGDFVLIQDADLEYDLDDYDVLLEPLASGREALVLGARHGGGAWWKMRQFGEQPLLSHFYNCGHWVFTTLLNTMFGQRLKDPFTMFKVFRRDCLYGLDFRCNRFDFDYELLIKLIRKGYRPVEVPVNYRSRSFKEGKKVNTFRDPLTWLRALAWLRFVPIDPLANVERARLAGLHRDEFAPAVRQAEAA